MGKQPSYRRNIFPPLEVAWRLCIAIVALYAVYRIPADLAVGHVAGLHAPFLDSILVAVFLIDPIVGYVFARGRGKHGTTQFLKTTLPMDVIAVTALVVFKGNDTMRLLALVKVIEITSFISKWRHQLLQRGNLVRLALFSYWMAILVHLVACGWVVLRYNPAVGHQPNEYLEAVYWAVTTLATIGYGDIIARTPSEMQYAIVVMLLGFVMMGYLVGNIASLLNRSDPLRAKYASALEEVTAFASYHGLSADLKYRIIDYFGYMWQQRAAFNESGVLNMLPSGIRTEIMLHLKRHVIQRVPFFREASEGFIREIANEMHPIVVTPSEYVFHAGDPASHMFFISSGILEVIDENGRVVGELGDGDFFGEMALLEKRRRMGSVRSLAYSDLYRLDSRSFERILHAHPDFKAYMERIAAERAESSDLVSGNPPT